MEQRGRSGQPVKGRRANRPKARKAPTTAPSIADLQMQVGTLTRESKEALERESATADILKVIASSPSDVQPVFEAIVGSAAKLFEPIAATITTVKDGKLHWGATAAVRPDFDVERTKTIYPIPFEPDRAASPRAILERRIIEIPDTEAPDTPELTRSAAAAGGFRSATYVPLIDKDQGIGTIIFAHPQAGFKFSEKQLALARTFADQAVIAIQNTRLFNETREALGRQTATTEVLQVINSSPGDLAPVFETILEKAHSLCAVAQGALLLYDGEKFRAVALRGLSGALAEWLRQGYVPGPNHPGQRLLQGERFAQVPDWAEIDDPTARATLDAGIRTTLFIPLRREEKLLG